jgi:hypothetical protein
MSLIQVHAAHAALTHTAAAHAGSATRGLGLLGAGGMGGKSRILGGEVILAAGGAMQIAGIGATANQLFEFGSTIVASIFEDRHASKITA